MTYYQSEGVFRPVTVVHKRQLLVKHIIDMPKPPSSGVFTPFYFMGLMQGPGCQGSTGGVNR